MSLSPQGCKSSCFIDLFFHLPVSPLLLLLLPPSSPLLFFCAVGVDRPWLRSWDLKGSAVCTSSQFPLSLPSSPPSRLAWASLLSLFTSRLSLRLSGHVLRLSTRPHISCFVLLLSLNGWLSVPVSLVGSRDCWSGRNPALAGSGNKNWQNSLSISKMHWKKVFHLPVQRESQIWLTAYLFPTCWWASLVQCVGFTALKCTVLFSPHVTALFSACEGNWFNCTIRQHKSHMKRA